MQLLILVNLQIKDTYGNKNIVATCIDLNPNNIQEIINGHDGITNVLMKNGRLYEIVAPFMEIITILTNRTEIVANYKDEVMEYIGDNWAAYLEKTNKDNGEEGTTSV